MAPIVDAHRARRSAGDKHPVIDFLFEYYRFRPASLLKWSPGLGVLLKEGGSEFKDRKGFAALGQDAYVEPTKLPARQIAGTQWILSLLEKTQSREPRFGCHGVHEWAMVYGSNEVRHTGTPLRVSGETIAQVVESGPLRCTHFDAFRFFTPDARPRNRLQLAGTRVHDHEQPGCLHANMDVYRWAIKRYPWIGSDLIADAFLLALDIREVDMRASPYDLSGSGYESIPIETAEGRATYRRLQATFHERALPIRRRLIEAYRRLLVMAADAA